MSMQSNLLWLLSTAAAAAAAVMCLHCSQSHCYDAGAAGQQKTNQQLLLLYLTATVVHLCLDSPVGMVPAHLQQSACCALYYLSYVVNNELRHSPVCEKCHQLLIHQVLLLHPV